ncbi:MAG: phosphatase PAP2 family protein [Thermoleophilia bacterium]
MSPQASLKGVAFTGALFLVLFGIFVAQLKRDGGFSWDDPVLDLLRERVPLAQKLVWRSILACLMVTLLAIGLLVQQRRFETAIVWVAAVGGAVALDPVLKALVARPALNPDSSEYSFPSGSAMLLLAVTIALIVSLPTKYRPVVAAFGFALILYQGAILVSTGWHYPSDIVGGWCATVAWLAIVLISVRGLSQNMGRQPEPGDSLS